MDKNSGWSGTTNYNHIEGNTLTYDETALLLIHDFPSESRPMRHHEEMKAHDAAIKYVRQFANEERKLSEGDVRDLNKILLKEPFWQDAETPDGQPTRKRIVPGEYKTQPNHVRTSTGALHRFAEPEDTPDLMKHWVSKFQRDLERDAYPLPLFLAESHHDFLQIHPFGDGNGRTARLLANYVLLRRHLPPMVIKSADRDRYFAELQKADLGGIVPLALFMLENILWSLNLAVRAAKGESINEPGDLRKRSELLARSRAGGKRSKGISERLDEAVNYWISPLVETMLHELDPLKTLFRKFSVSSFIKMHSGTSYRYEGNIFENQQWELKAKRLLPDREFRDPNDMFIGLGCQFWFGHYNGQGARGFSTRLSMGWMLFVGSIKLSASIDNKAIKSAEYEFQYGELHRQDTEIRRTIDEIGTALLDAIDRQSEMND